MKQSFSISGMSCANCVAHVEKAVKSLAGVLDVQVSLETNSMAVDYDSSVANNGMIIEAVVEEGYGAEAVN